MIERVLFQIISDGIAVLKDTPGLVTEVFTRDGLVELEEAQKIEALFQTETPVVVHGYARSDNKFPLYAITLGGDQQTQSFIGDEGGFVDDEEDPDHGADEYAAIYSMTYNLMVYAQNPDVVLYLYVLLKQVVIAGIDVLKSYGLFDIKFSGADMAPDPAWVPAGLFVRRVTITGSREYQQVREASKLGRAWKVAGIHTDSAGAIGEDVGDVKTLVYPVNPESED